LHRGEEQQQEVRNDRKPYSGDPGWKPSRNRGPPFPYKNGPVEKTPEPKSRSSPVQSPPTSPIRWWNVDGGLNPW